jgi:hypothetical protein
MLDLPVTFKESMTQEKPTLADVFDAVLVFLAGRQDVVVFGSFAVNAYAEPPRMTADIDMMSTNADRLLIELCEMLRDRFHVAVRVRSVAQGRGFRIYQLRKPENRHLIDVRSVDALPSNRRIGNVLVVQPEDLVVMKLKSFASRRHTDKGISDRLDIHRMLLTYPDFRTPGGPIDQRLQDADPRTLDAWSEIRSERIERADDDEY